MDTFISNWQQVLDLNLTSVFEWVRAVLPTMGDRRQGTIVKVSSVAGKQALPNGEAYCVSKFGIVGLTQPSAAEKQSKVIGVAVMFPGVVNTAVNRLMWDTETIRATVDRPQMLTPEIVAQSILSMTQLPVSATIEELPFMSNAGIL